MLHDHNFPSQDTVATLAQMLTTVLADPALKAALVSLLGELCKEPAVVQAVTDLALTVIARDDVYNVRSTASLFSLTLLCSDTLTSCRPPPTCWSSPPRTCSRTKRFVLCSKSMQCVD